MARLNKKDALAKSAKAFIRSNMGEEEDSLFPPVDDGNMGVCAYIASDVGGKVMLELAKELRPGFRRSKKTAFEPTKHRLVVVVTSEDEPHLHLIRLDRSSKSCTPLTDLSVVDLDSVTAETFASCFPGMSQEEGDWGALMTKLLGDAQYLDLGKGGADHLWWT